MYLLLVLVYLETAMHNICIGTMKVKSCSMEKPEPLHNSHWYAKFLLSTNILANYIVYLYSLVHSYSGFVVFLSHKNFPFAFSCMFEQF